MDGVREELEYSKKLSATDAVIPALKVAELERGTLDGGDVLFTGTPLSSKYPVYNYDYFVSCNYCDIIFYYHMKC